MSITAIITTIAGVITGIFGIMKIIQAYAPPKTDVQKVGDIDQNVAKEEQDFENSGRPQ